jgi:ABC-type bacteriocin/lantibiotic exporter with double-glycine peptidase domain
VRLTANEVGVLKPLGGSNPLVSATDPQPQDLFTYQSRVIDVLSVVKQALGFMSPSERIRYFSFLALRALVAFFDLIGILAIGFLATSVALFLTQGSDPKRVVELGSVSFPAVSAQSLPLVAILILLLFVFKAIVSILLTWQLARFLAKIEARAGRAISKNAFGKGLEAARLRSREEILFAVQAGSPMAFNSILNSVGTLAAEGFLFLLVLASFALVDPLYAFGAIAYFGVIGVLIQFFIGRVMHRTGVRMSESIVLANEGISDISEVLKEATIFGRRDFFYDKIYKSRLSASGNHATQFVLSGMPRYVVETALIVAIAIFVLLQTISGDIASSAATLAIFLSGGLRLTASLLPLQSAFLTIKQSIPPALRALELLQDSQAPEKEAQGLSSEFIEPNHAVSVRLEKVNFSYHSSETSSIREVSLEIPAGLQAAFIGTSGAGKSTLADLILGLIRPSSGGVYVEGKNPEEIIINYPGLMSYVPQKPGMVTGTIAQNIALGKSEAEIDQQKLEEAIRDAQLTDLLDSLPNGVHTDIGKRKDELSGGQLQRIGLARALYTRPKLLVLDEATSALDAESENQINKALERIRGKVTVILIAHRLNTIQHSDIVFLVESGSVSDSGTFQNLMKSNEVVKNLAKLMSIETEN